MSAKLSGTLVGDRFFLDELAGSGGMGEVYRASDLQNNGERVAVKILHAGGHAHVERFLREARLLARLEHSGIVRYIAHGESPSLFLAMEWLEGEDLGRAIARAPLDVRSALGLTRRVAEALLAAHRHGVVHRDIKPSNIFLCQGSLEQVKLLDFGIARLDTGTRAMTLSGQVLGTIGYMAPEQARERQVGSSADVFSLGCVLFECLAGTPAFPGDRLMAVLAKVLFAELPRLGDARPDVPPAVEDLVARMMQKLPEDRPTLPALIAELDELASDRFLNAPRSRARSGRPLVEPGERRPLDAPAVSVDERRLTAVLIAEHAHAERRDDSSLTLPFARIDHSLGELERAITPYEGRLELLASQRPMVILNGTGAATDLAARAARLALQVRKILPGPALAVAIGYRNPGAACDLEDVVSRAEHLLNLAKKQVNLGERRAIRIDRTLAGLLDARFAIHEEADGLELVAERSDVDPVRELLGRPAPFVGRDRELAMLRGVLEECFTEPIASAVVVSAPAGWGKSRLAHELTRSLDDRGVALWSTGADPMTRGTAFAMLSTLVKRLAGLEEGEPREAARYKLEARVACHVAARDVAFVTAFLGELAGLGLPDSGDTALRAAREDSALMGEQMRRAFETFVAAECAANPVLLVLEDLHWGDLPTVRFVDERLLSQRERPFMVLALARPEVHETFPDLWSAHRGQHVRLEELTPRAAKRLVQEVLGSEIGEETAATLVKRAAGNTFYLEELIRAFSEHGASTLPETVLAMAQARLEQLEPEARRALRAASVFGEVFWVGGVATLIGLERKETVAILEDLTRREFLARSASSRFRDEDELVFRHALIREAAYGMLPERDLQQGHRVASAWLEAAGERDALIMAEHLDRGGQPEGAVVWYLWAAEQALEANDYASVIARARRGIACGATGATLGELLLLEAEAAGWGPESHQRAELATNALALLPAGTGAHARAAAELTLASLELGELEALPRAIASLTSSIDACSRGLGVTHAIAIARTAIELYRVGRGDLAEPLVTRLESAPPGFPEEASILATIRSWVLAASALFSGQPELYVERGMTIVSALEECGQLRPAVLAEVELTRACTAIGAHDRALDVGLRALERATRMNLTVYAAQAQSLLGPITSGSLVWPESI